MPFGQTCSRTTCVLHTSDNRTKQDDRPRIYHIVRVVCQCRCRGKVWIRIQPVEQRPTEMVVPEAANYTERRPLNDQMGCSCIQGETGNLGLWARSSPVLRPSRGSLVAIGLIKCKAGTRGAGRLARRSKLLDTSKRNAISIPQPQ